MAITVAAYQSDLESARTALLAGSYQTARTYATSASIILAGLQNGAHAGTSVEHADPEALATIFAQIDALEAAANRTDGRRLATCRTSHAR